MSQSTEYTFGPFVFEPASGRLVVEDVERLLLPKDSAVLQCLLNGAGRIVSQDELFESVWSDTVVQSDVIRASIKRIRKLLNDSYKTPRYIETVQRRGYRFLAEVSSSESFDYHFQTEEAEIAFPVNFVGREKERDLLRSAMQSGRDGERNLVMIAGEAGVGKSTLVQAVIHECYLQGRAIVAVGNNTNSFGPGEPYAPFFEILEKLCNSLGKEIFGDLVRQYAPMWLVQLPWLSSQQELELLRAQLMGASGQRMIRELCKLLEVISMKFPLVLVLEDLHWADHATLSAWSGLAQRSQRSRILQIATYRSTEHFDNDVTVVLHELELSPRCQKIDLARLDVETIEHFLNRLYPGYTRPVNLAEWLHQHTEGNPLFFKALLKHSEDEGWLQTSADSVIWELPPEVETGDIVPRNLRNLIDTQLQRLPEQDLGLLTEASAVGMIFPTRILCDRDVVDREEQVDELLHSLAGSGRFVCTSEVTTWPDGRQSQCFSFTHSWYRQVIYDRMPLLTRKKIHKAIGYRLETIYNGNCHQVASELASHFELGGVYGKALGYRHQAGEVALSRNAYHEVKSHTLQGLRLLDHIDETEEKNIWGIRLRLPLGIALIATEGYSSVKVLDVYTKAQLLCEKAGANPLVLPILTGLFAYHFEKGDLLKSQEITGLFNQLTVNQMDKFNFIWLRAMRAVQAWYIGNFRKSLQNDEEGLERYSPSLHHQFMRTSGFDAGLICAGNRAMSLWKLGYAEQAESQVMEMLAMAKEVAGPFMIVWGLSAVAWIHMYQRNYEEGLSYADQSVRLGGRDGIDHWQIQSTILQGYLLAKTGRLQDGLALVRKVSQLHQDSGARLYHSMYAFMLADLNKDAGHLKEAMDYVDEGLSFVDRYNEHWWEAELYRLRGDILLSFNYDNPPQERQFSDAQESYELAIKIAQKQDARNFELRAATRLSQLLISRGQKQEAREMLIKITLWFTEGFDRKDLIEAKSVLHELGCDC